MGSEAAGKGYFIQGARTVPSPLRDRPDDEIDEVVIVYGPPVLGRFTPGDISIVNPVERAYGLFRHQNPDPEKELKEPVYAARFQVSAIGVYGEHDLARLPETPALHEIFESGILAFREQLKTYLGWERSILNNAMEREGLPWNEAIREKEAETKGTNGYCDIYDRAVGGIILLPPRPLVELRIGPLLEGLWEPPAGGYAGEA
jgi:hypothetical protein